MNALGVGRNVTRSVGVPFLGRLEDLLVIDLYIQALQPSVGLLG